MAAVATKLFDETVFPVEIGLHRTFLDIGAFIRTAIAVCRIGLRDQQRRANLKLAVIAALENVNLPSHLREP